MQHENNSEDAQPIEKPSAGQNPANGKIGKTTKKSKIQLNQESANGVDLPPAEQTGVPKPKRRVTNPLEHAEYFGKQYTKTSDLPNPTELVKVLACGIVQVLAGERQVDQLSKMLSEDLYLQLRDAARKNLRKQRYLANKPNTRLHIEVQRVKLSSPRDGVVESVTLLHAVERTRAVAIRLEGINSKWLATMVSVL